MAPFCERQLTRPGMAADKTRLQASRIIKINAVFTNFMTASARTITLPPPLVTPNNVYLEPYKTEGYHYVPDKMLNNPASLQV
jgi:hypothetical protein